MTVITLQVEVMITSELESVRIRAVLHQNMMRQLRINAQRGHQYYKEDLHQYGASRVKCQKMTIHDRCCN